jgi:hypothetical protein
MRRVVAPCLVAALTCVASDARSQSWDAGVKTGISRSEVPSDEFTWNGTSSSSFFLSRRLTRLFTLQPELAYFRRSGVSVVGASTLKLVADYLEVPVLVQAGLRMRSGFTPFLTGGPSFSFRVRCRLQFTGGGLTSDEDCNDRGEPSSRIDVGVAGGGGLAWSFDGTTVSIESRLTAGLRRYVLPTDVSDARTVNWSVLAGASVPLSRRRIGPPIWVPPRIPVPALPRAPSVAPRVTESRSTKVAAPRVTITADNADAREVLLAIARLGGIDVVVSSEIRSRVTAHLIDIPADQAIQAIAEVNGLGVLRPSARGGATVVFLQPPVNVNGARAETVVSRFGVSRELAKFVVETQPSSKPE